MAWREQPPRYTAATAPEDRYRAAAITWDGRYGEALIQARNWRLVAIGLLGIMTLLAGGVLWALQQRGDVPYVVVLDQTGDTVRIALAENDYNPTAAQIAYHLQDWVRWVRARPLDPLVFKQNWARAYAFLGDAARAKMNAYAKDNDPSSELGTIARDVRIKSVRQRSDDTFELAWLEDDWRDGKHLGSSQYSGTFLIEIEPPRNAEQISQNPLGITITEFGWSPDLER